MSISQTEIRNKTDRTMIHLIIGTPDSGKSALAEDIISDLASGSNKYYLATMIPYGTEGEERVARHRSMRSGKGFITVEMPFDVGKASLPEDCAVLLECVSNLAANELFERNTPADKCEDIIVSDIIRLGNSVRDLVIVTNHFDITDEFDAETVKYSLMMDRINHRLCVIADKVTDLTKRADRRAT
jgi:adenosylcobinamide kinase/adenosylcobinamide-phosphate guanylyltransferase